MCASCHEPLAASSGHAAGVPAPPPYTGMHCAMCARLHRDKQYCLICGRVWHYGQPFEGAQCDGCDFWIHGACDQASAVVARGGSSSTTYFCPPCRQQRQAETTKQKQLQQQQLAAASAAVPSAAPRAGTAGRLGARGPAGSRPRESGMPAALVAYINATSGLAPPSSSLAGPAAPGAGGDAAPAAAAPRSRAAGDTPKRAQRPKSAWQLFGKDFFAEYRASHPHGAPNFAEVYRLQGEAWRTITASERERYDQLAAAEAALLKQRMHEAATVLAAASSDPEAAAEAAAVPPGGQVAVPVAVRAEAPPPAPRPAAPRMRGLLPVLPCPPVVLNRAGFSAPVGIPASSGLAVPALVRVLCNGIEGDLVTSEFRIACACAECDRRQPAAGRAGGQLAALRTFSCAEWERHVGMGHAKKWKGSIRLIHPGFERMPIGRWIDGGTGAGARRAREAGAGGGAAPGVTDDCPVPANYVPPSGGPLGFEPVVINWSVDRCAVCDDDRDFEWDQLVSCDGCHVAVHQSCYGVTTLPDAALGWLCTACEETGGSASEQKRCALCPVEGGALKPTTIPGLWAHSACCQWIPETCVVDIKAMQPIDRLRHIQRERWELLCTICKQRYGAKVQCEHAGCYLAFHPLCGRASGLFMEAQEEEGDPIAAAGGAAGGTADDDDGPPVRMVAYCHKHYPPDPHRQAMYGGRNVCAPGSSVLPKPQGEQQHPAHARDAVVDDAPLPDIPAAAAAAAVVSAPTVQPSAPAAGESAVPPPGEVDMGDPGGTAATPVLEPPCDTAVDEDMVVAPRIAAAQPATAAAPPAPRVSCARERVYVPVGHPRTEAAPQAATDTAPAVAPSAVGDAEGGAPGEAQPDGSHPAAAAAEGEQAAVAAMPSGQVHMRRAIRDDTAAADAIEHGAAGLDDNEAAMPDAGADHKRRRSSEIVVTEPASKKPRRAAAPLDEDADAPLPAAMPSDDDLLDAAGMELDEHAQGADAAGPGGVDDGAAEALGEGEPAGAAPEQQEPPADEPPRPPPGPVRVACRSLEGTYLPDLSRISCDCARCEAVKEAEGSPVLWTPPQWENHAGMGQAKKWKSSIRVILQEEDDAGREAALGEDNPGEGSDGDAGGSAFHKNWVFIGRWFEMVGLAPRSNRPEQNGRPAPAAAGASDGQQVVRLHNGRFTSPATVAAAAATGQLLGHGRFSRATLQPAAIDSEVARKAVTTALVSAATAATMTSVGVGTARAAAAAAQLANVPTVDELITAAALALMGAKLRVLWPSDGTWHSATVVAVCCVRSLARHRLLYDEPAGAEEWVMLAAEQVEYIQPASPPGLPPGTPQPTLPPNEFNQAGTGIDPLTWQPAGAPPPEPISTGPMPAQEQARLAREQADEAAATAATAQVAATAAAARAEAAAAAAAAVVERSARLGCGREGWMCCDGCGKWRRAPAEVADDVARRGGSAQWFCTYNASVDPAYASCEAPQELSDADIDDLIAQGNAAQEAAQEAAARAAEATENASDACADAQAAAAAADAAVGGGAALEELAAILPGGAAAAVLAAHGTAITVAFNLPMQPVPLRASNSMLSGPLPGIFMIVARNTPGELRLKDQLVRCVCRACAPTEYRNPAPGCDADTVVNNTGSAVRGCFFDPNKWECHVGMGQAKKWKSSVRIILEDGTTVSVGSWLEALGQSKAKIKAPKPDNAPPPTAAAVLREQRLAELQANRKQQAGGGGGKNERQGKRLYVEAMPYIVRQVGPHRAEAAAGGLLADGSCFNPLAARVMSPDAWAAVCRGDDEGPAAAAPPAAEPPAAAAPGGADAGDAAAGPEQGGAAAVATVPLRERLAECRRTERERLMFGKSSIHGWGLFTRAAHPVGAMVVEYRGERVRTTVADIREARYARAGQDCYLLRLDDQHTIDSTVSGNVARFTNHSCNPNMYAKVLNVDGQSHVRYVCPACETGCDAVLRHKRPLTDPPACADCPLCPDPHRRRRGVHLRLPVRL